MEKCVRKKKTYEKIDLLFRFFVPNKKVYFSLFFFCFFVLFFIAQDVHLDTLARLNFNDKEENSICSWKCAYLFSE